MTNLNEQVVRMALQDHLAAGRTPAEAAGELRYVDEKLAEQGIVDEETAKETRKLVEVWLAEAQSGQSDDLETRLRIADEYNKFLHEHAVFPRNQMPDLNSVWQEWRRTREAG